ncbi:MAG: single-stranded DNA-binding protein [Anaerolineales bacterium]
MLSRGLNKVTIIGRLERAPEMRFTPNGRAVTSFSVATVHSWLSSEGVVHEETEWFNVVAWAELARSCHAELDRGSPVYVEGRLKTRSWEDDDGKRYFRTEIVAQRVLALDALQPGDGANLPDDDYDF